MIKIVIILLVIGTVIAVYQNLHWDCREPGGGRAGGVTSFSFLQHKLNPPHMFFPYKVCDSRFPWGGL